MEASKNGLTRILTAVERLNELLAAASGDALTADEQAVAAQVKELVEKYEAAMEDDFNTADAISAVFELVKLANTSVDGQSTKALVEYVKKTIDTLCDVLGIITEKKEELLDADIEALIAERQQARKDKNFARADEIRDTLAAKGILLKDTREGVKWTRA